MRMIEERVTGVDCSEAITLGAADVPEMLELVAETELVTRSGGGTRRPRIWKRYR
jgi:hypothetical protein